ncbi:MAG: hypothetical protein JO131_02155 [Gammaproteobacteria bacterium]|nr:hypothetical protein [Gammaproteobacteria bacterium]
MAKKDIYILSSQYDEGKKIEWKGTHSQNPNIILLEEKEKLAGNKAMVFHKEALKNLLKCNESIVLGMLNREKFFADAKIGIRSTKENRFKKIDDSVVNAFVELVGRKDFSIGANECKALVDAAFADNNFLQNATWRKIKLTNELNEYFIQKYFPQWGQVDWKAIEKEYNEKKTFMSSSESHVLSNNIISPLAKGDKSLHYIDAINQYIKKYPERKLSKIILSKLQDTPGVEVNREFKYR